LAILNGLNNLSAVGGSFYMYYNFQLRDCCAITDLLDNGGVAGVITIFFNATGCNSQGEILADCSGGNNLITHPQINWDNTTSPEQTMPQLKLYPNPSDGKVFIELD